MRNKTIPSWFPVASAPVSSAGKPTAGFLARQLVVPLIVLLLAAWAYLESRDPERNALRHDSAESNSTASGTDAPLAMFDFGDGASTSPGQKQMLFFADEMEKTAREEFDLAHGTYHTSVSPDSEVSYNAHILNGRKADDLARQLRELARSY